MLKQMKKLISAKKEKVQRKSKWNGNFRIKKIQLKFKTQWMDVTQHHNEEERISELEDRIIENT